MASVSWGAPKLEMFKLTAGQVIDDTLAKGDWASKPNYVAIEGSRLLEGSSTLETTAGEEKTLKNAFGLDVDSKVKPSSYSFSTSVIRQKTDTTDVVESNNGIVAGEWAFRLTPEDPETLGFIFRKASISVSKGWSEDNGITENLTIKGVEPNGTDKEICKILQIGAGA